MREAGFADLAAFPALVTLDRPGGPTWRNREDHVLSLSSSDERHAWQAERDRAAVDGLLLMTPPLHGAVRQAAAAVNITRFGAI